MAGCVGASGQICYFATIAHMANPDQPILPDNLASILAAFWLCAAEFVTKFKFSNTEPSCGSTFRSTMHLPSTSGKEHACEGGNSPVPGTTTNV